MSADPLTEAVDWLRAGELIAFATETVWGLGADARCDAALERLQRFKGRDPNAPISILVDGTASLSALGFEPGPAARVLAERFWPGPLTLVMPCKRRFAAGVARADGAVGVRCSPHPAAAALAKRLVDTGVGPVTATSLNRSGGPPARSRDEASAVCGDVARADCADAEPRLLELPDDAGGGRESTVVDLCGPQPVVLRWGAIDESELATALEEIAT